MAEEELIAAQRAKVVTMRRTQIAVNRTNFALCL
jgi:hypothetical protein